MSDAVPDESDRSLSEFRDLLASARQSRPGIERALGDFVQDMYGAMRRAETTHDHFNEVLSLRHDPVEGTLGFFVVATLCDVLTAEVLDKYLSMSSVREFIRATYKVPSDRSFDSLTFHKAGSTSVILKATESHDAYACKLLKPVFWASPTCLAPPPVIGLTPNPCVVTVSARKY